MLSALFAGVALPSAAAVAATVAAADTRAIEVATPRTDCAALLSDQAVVFADMHDGDEKIVTITATTIQIDPWLNNQTWSVRAPIADDCTASIDFRVPGKPSPPPCALKASVAALGARRAAIVFTDPSGTISPKGKEDYPLNAWVSAAFL